MRILIAEDDFASRRYLSGCLQKYGRCDAAVDGLEAVEAFQTALDEMEPYHLICLDIMMPAMDGYQALQQIRRIETEYGIPDESAAKVVITTALKGEHYENKAFDLGCAAYLQKPYDQGKLERLLDRLTV